MGKANINIKRGEQCKLRIMEREIIVSCTILAPKCTLYQLLWHLGVPCTIVPTCTLYHCTYVYLVPTIVAPTCTLYQSTTKIVWQLSVLEQIKETKSSRHNKIDINIKRHSMPLPTKSRGRLVGRKEGQKKGQVR